MQKEHSVQLHLHQLHLGCATLQGLRLPLLILHTQNKPIPMAEGPAFLNTLNLS